MLLIDLLDGVFDAMRVYAVDHATVLHRALELAAQVGAVSRQPVVLARLIVHVRRVVDAFERSTPLTSNTASSR